MKMTNKEYRNDPAISRSELFEIRKSPLHFKYMQDSQKEDTPSLLFGRALHKMILEPDSFDKEFAVAPVCDRRTKAGREQYNAFLVENIDKDVICQDDYYIMLAMADVVNRHDLASKLLAGKHEQSFFWTDPDTGERCKVRPDCMTEYDGQLYLVDYKTTDSCAGSDFERSVRKYGYDFQAGMYTEGVFANTFERYGFKFIAQEKKPPYAVRVYDCSEEFIQQGYDKFREYIGIYHQCKTSGIWYGYEGPDNTETELLAYGEGE